MAGGKGSHLGRPPRTPGRRRTELVHEGTSGADAGRSKLWSHRRARRRRALQSVDSFVAGPASPSSSPCSPVRADRQGERLTCRRNRIVVFPAESSPTMRMRTCKERGVTPRGWVGQLGSSWPASTSAHTTDATLTSLSLAHHASPDRDENREDTVRPIVAEIGRAHV